MDVLGAVILHAKHHSMDDDAARHWFEQHVHPLSCLEVSLLVRGRSFVTDMRAGEQKYRDAGRELTLAERFLSGGGRQSCDPLTSTLAGS